MRVVNLCPFQSSAKKMLQETLGEIPYLEVIPDFVCTQIAEIRLKPDLAHVQDGSYPLARPLFFYLRAKPQGETKSFIDWILSPEGQGVVTKVGYFPVK